MYNVQVSENANHNFEFAFPKYQFESEEEAIQIAKMMTRRYNVSFVVYHHDKNKRTKIGEARTRLAVDFFLNMIL